MLSTTVRAQQTDSLLFEADTANIQSDTAAVEQHSPRTAAIYSALLPGLGQIYNKKYWKVPIVYLGFGGGVGSVIYNATNYKFYKEKYIHMLENALEEHEDQSLDEVAWYKDTHRRYRDLFVILTAAFWGLQVIDANVDAHLINFDISEDLSLQVDPVMIPQPGTNYSFGLSCSLHF